MVVNDRSLKRTTRRVTADLHDFLTFPAGAGGDLDGPFRSSVRAFLSQHARLPHPPSVSPLFAANLMTWRVAFRVGEAAEDGAAQPQAVVELDVVEEDVPRSRSVYCDQCRVVGWSGHPVCWKRYHFIIRNDRSPLSGDHRPCPRCGNVLHLSDIRCSSCKCETTAEDIEDWAYLQLENSCHLLHGVVHSNGHGHLLRVNGREGGSSILTGSDIMGFWDRICKMLHVRKVTVMDMSKKYGLEYRLLQAVTTGQPWYGEWGYEFGAGSYGTTPEAYHEAMETICNVPLSIFFPHARSPRTRLQDTISLYSALSDCQLVTLKDLFCYLMGLLHDAHEQRQAGILGRKEPEEAASGLLSTWNKENIDQAENAIVKVLRAVRGPRWVTWRSLRRAACGSVSSPELLDYCLKGLGGKPVDNGMMVAVRYSADTSAIEYRLEAVSDHPLTANFPCRPSKGHLLNDLRFLYDALLNPATMDHYKPTAIRDSMRRSAEKILDCKQFVKLFDELDSIKASSNPLSISVWYHVELIGQPKDCTSPPPEHVVLPVAATVADLKLQGSRAFQETYVLFQGFQAELLVDFPNADDTTAAQLLVGTKGVVTVRGSLLGLNRVVRFRGEERSLWNFRKERGPDNWIVDCSCGAKDDDGERMMACDTCGVWQHTRCAGICDYEEVPAKFLCKKCASSRKRKVGSTRSYKDCDSNIICQDDITTISNKDEERYKRHLTNVG